MGARMRHVFHTLPPGPAIIIGTDVPHITASDIAQAFSALEGANAVIGPAVDGGYWLIGLRNARKHPALFDGVRWSTSHSLQDTLATLRGGPVAFLKTRRDVDTAADLASYPGWARLITAT